ncbi:hypothetical protein G6F57_006397 [Rhizopus arrhizus]|uniref:WW domain-containing protein n=1 Tax=Rhizopus oryzae TaxID=64495 RepID=A0A9P7BS89_RHIOR|nr:hypothetical protein G6F23_010998 [Rhizopus arrhizus]KAG1393936.1 hypothetical protein G6F58_012215 [Rhizopus delemar]KAG0763327.1 hypothetical protein G6F24_006101 [Rhizopus arrhizus]KAG0775074.1 hypothetical protein G6F22_013575 [Rhizopus arrhizus]KAG0794831.1 hypothetical protein G6F21_002560 [Rhizopus arrhizus]
MTSTNNSNYDQLHGLKKNGSEEEHVDVNTIEQLNKGSEQKNECENEPDRLKDEKDETVNKHAESEQKDSGTWTSVWDDNYKNYYWWNTSTNETTWVDPNAEIKIKNSDPSNYLLDPETRKKIGAGELNEEEKLKSYAQITHADANPQSYYQTQDYSQLYTTQAYFNARTGKFTAQEDATRLNPENFTIENRATRQMQFYFDVDAYTEERNRMRLLDKGTRKKLTRKELERFKKMKQEKKNKRAREWLLQ